MLTHNRFITYFVSFFYDLNKAQNYKMLCRVSSHDKIEILISFKYLKKVKPNEHTQDCHNTKPNDGIFLFENEDKSSFTLEIK